MLGRARNRRKRMSLILALAVVFSLILPAMTPMARAADVVPMPTVQITKGSVTEAVYDPDSTVTGTVYTVTGDVYSSMALEVTSDTTVQLENPESVTGVVYYVINQDVTDAVYNVTDAVYFTGAESKLISLSEVADDNEEVIIHAQTVTDSGKSDVAVFKFKLPAASQPGGGGGGGGGGGSSSPSSKTVTISANSGSTITFNGAKLVIPAGAFDSSFTVTVKKVSTTSDLSLGENQKLISDVYEFTKDKAGDFKKPVTITLPFDKSKVDTEQYVITLAWYDEDSKTWVELDNINVDLSNEEVSGDVNHFTKFAVIATEKAPEQETTEPETPSVQLSDIKGHWAEDAINKLVASGAIKGYPDGTFRPDNTITRAEFATVLVQAFDLDIVNGKVFNDTMNHWAKDYIATAAANGIVAGYSSTAFGPDDPITREQMALMIVKAAHLETATGGKVFNDSAKISTWAKDAIATATEHGVLNGYPDNTFKPQGHATRAEAVTTIVKALELNQPEQN